MATRTTRRQRDGVHQWLVPHRRPGRPRRGRLSAPDRPAEGDDQPRRREDQPARSGRVLMDHPAVAQAVTFAMPHAMLGEEVAAAVVLREGAHCGGARVARLRRPRGSRKFKVPRKIMFLARSRRARPASCSGSGWPRSSASIAMKIASSAPARSAAILGVKLAAAGADVTRHRPRAASGRDAGDGVTLISGGETHHSASALRRRCR